MEKIIKIISVVLFGVLIFALFDFIIQKLIHWFLEKTSKNDNVKEGKK